MVEVSEQAKREAADHERPRCRGRGEGRMGAVIQRGMAESSARPV